MANLPFVLRAAICALAAAACGAGAAGERLDGRLVLAREPARGPLAVTPLVRKADAQITALLGHPVTFAFDAAVIPRWEAAFQVTSEEAVTAVARRLAELAESDRGMFAWIAPRLRRIEWDFSATAKYASYTFEPTTGRLRVVLAADAPMLDPRELGFALGRSYAEALGGRFAAMAPSAVPVSERKAYAEWLFEYAYGAEKARDGTHADGEIDGGRARVLERMLRLHAAIAASDAALEKETRARLVEEAKWLGSTRRNDGDALGRLPRDHDYLRAEAAFVAWLRTNDGRLSTPERRVIADEISSSSDDAGRVAALPGYDVVDHWARALDRWLRAGAPVQGGAAPEDDVHLYELVVGTFEIPADDDAGCRSQRNPVYLAARQDGPTRKRVFAEALGKRDARVTKIVLANLLGLDDDGAALAFWRATEGDDAAFRAATRVLAAHVDRCRRSDAAYDTIPRLWRAYPARRPLLAYLLRRFSSEGYRQNFARLFGALDQAQFAATLDEERDPLRELHSIWRDLGAGWSRADVVLPRLDRLVTDDYKKRETWWGSSVEALASDMCAEHGRADVAKLHAWIERRVQARPSELDALGAALARSAPKACGD